MAKQKCPKCRTNIDAMASRCSACHYNLTADEMKGAEISGMIKTGIKGALFVAGIFLVSHCSNTSPVPEEQHPQLSGQAREKCEEFLNVAMTTGVVRKIDGDRMDVDEVAWAMVEVDVKRAMMVALSCHHFGTKMPPTGLNVVIARGVHSGKTLAALTSAGLDLDSD